MVARIANLLGVDLGPTEDLLAPHEIDNPTGYWEPRWMIQLNEELLAAVGGEAWRPLWSEPDWASSELDELRGRARKLLEEKFSGAALWGWKDPRTSVTLPFWQPLLGDGLKYVICIRSPVDAVASALRRPGLRLDRWSWGQLWLEYTGRALRETTGRERLIVCYEDLFTDLDEQLERLARFLGVDSPSEDVRTEVRGFIRDDLRHHRTSALEIAADDGLPVSARAMFLELRAAQDRGGAPVAHRGDAEALERMAAQHWHGHRDLVQARTDGEEAASLRVEVDALETSLGECQGALRESRSRERGLFAEYESTQGALELIQSSKSWRFTAPLRALAERIGRAR